MTNPLIVSKHARQRLLERLGSAEISEALMSRLREANDAGACGLSIGKWLYVIKSGVLVTVRPMPRAMSTGR